MTIYDISEIAGVSIATVSRVLNGSPNVSENTRQKVLDVIAKCDYTPNIFARGLGLNTMRTIGIMCADSSDLYLAKAIYFIEQKLRANGYDSILCCTGYDHQSKVNSMNLLLTKKVDSIILVGSNFVCEDEADNQYIANGAAQIPIMLLNAFLPIPNVYCVLSDDYTSTYETTVELLQSGVSSPLFFYSSTSYSAKRKLAGFLTAMKDNKMPQTAQQVQFFHGSHEDIPGMMEQLLQLYETGQCFDGVIAADDNLALAAVKFAREAGLCIPHELAVIGYNNSMLVHCCDPELTSVDNKLELLCQQLILTLMRVFEGKEMPKKTVFSGELIKRGTTF